MYNCKIQIIYHIYYSRPDRCDFANGVDPAQTQQNVESDQDRLIQQFLDTSTSSKIKLLKFWDKFCVRILRLKRYLIYGETMISFTVLLSGTQGHGFSIDPDFTAQATAADKALFH